MPYVTEALRIEILLMILYWGRYRIELGCSDIPPITPCTTRNIATVY